ncbi:MAG: DNA primase [Tannerella sp.]|jgi:DNA primase|nr:DNA primase [Tannerella sp.]
MIDKLTADKIFDSAQIVDVVSDFVTLKKRGVNYVGLCPFHADSSPSFYVSPSKNICKCFSCGEGGTAVQFIMKHEQIAYPEALRYLARKYGIEVKERELTDDEKRIRSERESMMVVNSWAQKFFTSRLNGHEEGQTVGMPYFVERGFREDIIRKFQLGYSLVRRDDLYRSAREQGFNESYLLSTGLVYKREDGSITDRFHGRVIFPVHTLSGRVVAFGGRILGKKDKVAKYVNSPESEIYHKSNELYGIYFAKQAINREDRCYLVEGYTDVISMHQSGIENVVASSGTSLTSGQIRMIHRFTNNITVLYDGDAAGIKASIRGINMFLEEGMNVKVVLLPDGEDPDSFARSRNSFDFNLFMKEHEVDFIRFKADLFLNDAKNDPIRKVNLIKDVMESIAVIPDNITRSVYIRECSQILNEKEQDLINEVIRIRSLRKTAVRPMVERQQAAIRKDEDGSKEKITTAEDAPKIPVAENITRADESVAPKPRVGPSPFEKYESALVKYCVSFGERPLFANDGAKYGYDKPFVKVAEYIHKELKKDGIELQKPIYKQVIEEAVAGCDDDDFVASRYFLTHIDLEISKLAVNMMSNKYSLSKYFKNHEDVALLHARITGDEQKALAEKKAEKEHEQREIERWVVNDIYVLKYEYVKHEIDEINRQIKEFQADEAKVTDLMIRKMALDRKKRSYSKELGERIIISR